VPKPITRQARPVLWSDELLRLPAGLLRQLPLESKFCGKVRGIKGDVVFCTHPLAEPRPRSLEPTFDGAELQALILGVEADRIGAQDLLRLCQQKRDDAEFRVTAEHTLAGAQPDAAVSLSLSQVLRALDVRLTRVALVDDEPASVALEVAA
jgi:hypothetical protein